jgi:cyclopropane fatty-acyl-phospholipid synthase-like methyltransferase
MFDYETAVSAFGTQDIIYSVGYFDYLADDFLVKLLNSLYLMLNSGGKLIAAFKDANRYRPQAYHWLVDWDGFLQRTQDDFDRLFRKAEIPVSALSMTRVRSGVIIFYTATKH